MRTSAPWLVAFAVGGMLALLLSRPPGMPTPTPEAAPLPTTIRISARIEDGEGRPLPSDGLVLTGGTPDLWQTYCLAHEPEVALLWGAAARCEVLVPTVLGARLHLVLRTRALRWWLVEGLDGNVADLRVRIPDPGVFTLDLTLGQDVDFAPGTPSAQVMRQRGIDPVLGPPRVRGAAVDAATGRAFPLWDLGIHTGELTVIPPAHVSVGRYDAFPRPHRRLRPHPVPAK